MIYVLAAVPIPEHATLIPKNFRFDGIRPIIILDVTLFEVMERLIELHAHLSFEDLIIICVIMLSHYRRRRVSSAQKKLFITWDEHAMILKVFDTALLRGDSNNLFV